MHPLVRSIIDELNFEEEFIKLFASDKIRKEIESRYSTKEDFEKITKIAAMFYVAGAELVKGIACMDIEKYHENLMTTNPDYAEKFNARTITPGKTITVTLDVRKRYGSDELMNSFYSEGPNSEKNEKHLVAGCRVIGIQYYDTNQKYMQLKKDIQDRLAADN